MALDPRIILSIPAAMDQNRARNIQQQQADTNGIEAQLRAAELQQRMQELRDAASRKNQPAAGDPAKELDYQLKLGNAVTGIFQQAAAHPESWPAARAAIGRLAGPQAMQSLPEQWDENTAAFVAQQVQAWPQHEAEVKSNLVKVTHYDPDTDSNVDEFVVPTAGVKYTQAKPKATAEGDLTKSGIAVQAADALRRGDTEEYKRLLKVQHDVGTSDDRPLAGAAGLGPAVVIKPNSREFRLAQDIAYGKLTLSDFRSMMGRAASNADLKLGIYDKARELNPDFNPAQFEMGYKLASNPKVQQQLASLDNVIVAVPDLIKASDAAARTNFPLINKFSQAAGIGVGNKKYSNFGSASLAFADELSGALGYGSATDMSREMGIKLTDPNLSPQQFSSQLQDVVVPFINRKRATLLRQMGVYGQAGMNPAGDAAAAQAPPPPAATPAAPRVNPFRK